jgi:hypothetical protein
MMLNPSLSLTMAIERTMPCESSSGRSIELPPGAAVVLSVPLGVLVWIGVIGWALA